MKSLACCVTRLSDFRFRQPPEVERSQLGRPLCSRPLAAQKRPHESRRTGLIGQARDWRPKMRADKEIVGPDFARLDFEIDPSSPPSPPPPKNANNNGDNSGREFRLIWQQIWPQLCDCSKLGARLLFGLRVRLLWSRLEVWGPIELKLELELEACCSIAQAWRIRIRIRIRI